MSTRYLDRMLDMIKRIKKYDDSAFRELVITIETRRTDNTMLTHKLALALFESLVQSRKNKVKIRDWKDQARQLIISEESKLQEEKVANDFFEKLRKLNSMLISTKDFQQLGMLEKRVEESEDIFDEERHRLILRVKEIRAIYYKQRITATKEYIKRTLIEETLKKNKRKLANLEKKLRDVQQKIATLESG